MENSEVIAKGRCDKIGYEDSNIIYKNLRDNKSLDEALVSMPDHKIGMKVPDADDYGKFCENMKIVEHSYNEKIMELTE